MPTPAGSDLQALQAAPLERQRRAPGAHPRTRGPLTLLLASLLLLVGVVAGLARVRGEPHALASTPSQPPGRLDMLATEFVRIALAFAQHKPDEVDSYFGPASLRPAARAAPVPLGVLAQRARRLVEQLDRQPPQMKARPEVDAGAGPDAGSHARQARLLAEARALATVIGEPHVSFDDEAREMYGMSFEDGMSAAHAEGPATAQIDAALAALDRVLPHLEPSPQAYSRSRPLPKPDPQRGSAPESLAARFGEYRKRFAIPADRRRAVFDAALEGCRARTAARWTLPAGEHLEVKWDITAPGAWHRYEGGGRSTLTINPAAVEFIDTAVDLACHEGYPGHHVQFLLADRIGRAPGRAPLEETVALLRSPVAMLREGAANYAVDLAFPPDDRLRFERDTLFPLAGLDAATTASAAPYVEVRRLVRALEPAIIPILRAYRDGRLSAPEAADRLERRALVTSPQALLRFVDDLGPYVLGYTIARDRIATYVATQSRSRGVDAWTILEALLTSPDPAVLTAPLAQPPPSTN